MPGDEDSVHFHRAGRMIITVASLCFPPTVLLQILEFQESQIHNNLPRRAREHKQMQREPQEVWHELVKDEFRVQQEITELKENPIISPKLLLERNAEIKAHLKQIHAKIKVKLCFLIRYTLFLTRQMLGGEKNRTRTGQREGEHLD